eukprot:CAMPEP_0194167068 /NCGR_PEP_ID=MMETSP0154-20130528/2482_1 /TAXON_ID=1049557 /ORGANISM="Thalassiothrix antarctica, Strain L6-D1" /LENGTH=546 /DNA_ID=CAMNT_0038877897 /DNA_START=17 /DNA_END=1657 /DNA_ORIENTATION=+
MSTSDSDSDNDLLNMEPSGLSQSSAVSAKNQKGTEEELIVSMEENEEERNKVAYRRAQSVIDSVNVPAAINDTRQLYWHKLTQKKNICFLPCRICPKDKIIGLNLKQDFDQERRTAIEYLSFAKGGKHSIAYKSRLIPCGNECWDADLMKKYMGSLRARKNCTKEAIRLEIRKEELYLKKIFDAARQRETQKRDEKQEVDEIKDFLPFSSESDFLDDFSNKRKRIGSPLVTTPSSVRKKKKQSLKAGDWIEYTKSIFVAGDERGKTHAIIVEVVPSGEKRLVLHPCDEILLITHMVKRLATRGRQYHGKVRYETIESPTFQQIREHRLITSKLPVEDPLLQSISSTTDNLFATIEQHMAIFTQQVKREGLDNFLDTVKPNHKIQGELKKQKSSNYCKVEIMRQLKIQLQMIQKHQSKKKSPGRRKKPYMTEEMLQVAIAVHELLATSKLVDRLTGISQHELDIFLKGDSKKVFGKEQHEKTCEALQKLLRHEFPDKQDTFSFVKDAQNESKDSFNSSKKKKRSPSIVIKNRRQSLRFAKLSHQCYE